MEQTDGQTDRQTDGRTNPNYSMITVRCMIESGRAPHDQGPSIYNNHNISGTQWVWNPIAVKRHSQTIDLFPSQEAGTYTGPEPNYT